MEQDTISIDPAENRPLPKWLTDQRDGLNTYQPVKMEIKKDYSLTVSLAITGIFVLLIVTILTIFIHRRKSNSKS